MISNTAAINSFLPAIQNTPAKNKINVFLREDNKKIALIQGQKKKKKKR